MTVQPVYANLEFPAPPPDRPYVVMNMVSTIDGKILSGNRDENVMDLGSPTDHATMRAIECSCEAVMIGAGSLRATPGLWFPLPLRRFVVSGSGLLDYASRFFTDEPSVVAVVTTPSGHEQVPVGVRSIVSGPPVDLRLVLQEFRHHFSVTRLLVEGGSELNAALLALDLVDELFLTLAPKVKLGRDVPTMADGEPLPRGSLLRFQLVGCHPVDDEVYLRYRRNR